MREILFRGKVTDNYYVKEMRGTWVEGNLVHKTEYYGMPVDEYHILYTGEFHVDYYDAAEVIPETIGQFTGRYDKNGKKIFEGDIVRRCRNAFDFEPRETWVFEIGHIEYNMGGFVVPELSSYDGYSDLRNILDELTDSSHNYYPTDTFEVIGNIYDNPELLED